MSSLPSFEQFNESITITNINEGVFYRLPKDVIANELYLATKNLANFYQNTSAGRDIDTGVIDTIVRGLDKVKKSVKKFNSKEEVIGTVYEAEKLVFDEIGAELEALQKKILDLMKNTTDSKWKTALGSASTALSNLDRNLSQADAKLGVIPIKESDEVNEGDINLNNISDIDHTRVIKWIGQNLSGDVDVKKSDKGFKIDGSKIPSKDKNDLIKYLKSNNYLNESDVNEASVQVAGHGKPSGAQVLATVIIDMLDKQDFLHPDTKKSQKQLIDMVKNVIMDSTF